MFRNVDIGVRFSRIRGSGGEVPFDMYEEVQQLLDRYFKSRFVDRHGTEYHVQVVLCEPPPRNDTRVRRVRAA